MKYLKTYENSNQLYYPYEEIYLLISPYTKKMYDEWEKEGWSVFSSDTDYYKKYHNIHGKLYFDIQHFDDGPLNNDEEAVNLAKKSRLNIKYNYLVVGIDDINFVGLTINDFRKYEYQKILLDYNIDSQEYIRKIGINDDILEEYGHIFDSSELGII
jgi:hypothetical protein